MKCKVERPKIDFSEIPPWVQVPSCADRLEAWLSKEIKEKIERGWTETEIREYLSLEMGGVKYEF